ncbi:MAG: sensor domain-containing diguanylate cyclase [Solirubrobacteraceae bacterium]
MNIAAIDPEERQLAGRSSGVLWALGGSTLALLPLLPGVTHRHELALWLMAIGACLWGACLTFVIDWDRAPWWFIHISNVASMVLIGITIALTGGGRSPAWVFVFLVAMPGAYFYRPPVAAAYLAGCVVINLSVFVYDPQAVHGRYLPELVIAVPSYLALGGATIAGKQLLRRLRRRSEELAAEQGALRRVATAIAGGDSPEQLYELVAREAGDLLGAGAAGIMRMEDPRHTTVMGAWADRPGGRYEAGTVVPVRPGSDMEQAIATRRPVRISDHQPGSPVIRLGYRASIVAPVLVADRLWGVLAITSAEPGGLRAGDEQRLTEFANLLEVAITSIEDRSTLLAQAASDALTGLANHRTLRDRLAREATRARRQGAPLSLAVIDIDYFKQVNDSAGHEAGDELLMRIAACLSTMAGSNDTLARISGDEFAWVLPGVTRDQALVSVERARQAIAQVALPRGPITVSAGICDLGAVGDPGELLRRAHAALYWSKLRGRDQAWVYDPIVAEEFSAS